MAYDLRRLRLYGGRVAALAEVPPVAHGMRSDLGQIGHRAADLPIANYPFASVQGRPAQNSVRQF